MKKLNRHQTSGTKARVGNTVSSMRCAPPPQKISAKQLKTTFRRCLKNPTSTLYRIHRKMAREIASRLATGNQTRIELDNTARRMYVRDQYGRKRYFVLFISASYTRDAGHADCMMKVGYACEDLDAPMFGEFTIYDVHWYVEVELEAIMAVCMDHLSALGSTGS